jgi:hypothetical protein
MLVWVRREHDTTVVLHKRYNSLDNTIGEKEEAFETGNEENELVLV